MYTKETITGEFPEVLRSAAKGQKFDLSTVFEGKQKVLNSEIKHQCWYIDNPKQREFLKVVTMKMGPNAIQKFVIILKAPLVRQAQNMISAVNIGLLTYKDERLGVDMTFEELLKYHYEGSMKYFM
jgi:hypothetical protein